MSGRGVVLRFCGAVLGVALVSGASAVRAQTHEHQPPPAGQDVHTHEDHAEHGIGEMAREGSGTAWLPDASPMYALHTKAAGWQLMAHGNVFAQLLHESGDRGADQFGSINWLMGTASRPLGPGRVSLRGMISLEPWSVGGCGYPDLLASGERCHGEPIHDRQHPHDFAMELAIAYDAPLIKSTRWQVYGGPAAEPALGPVAYPHRLSAMPNLLAPIAHHWLDATHITFGSITGGVYGSRWKAEGSTFNGREPDERRTDLDVGRLDSFSGRFWLLPAPSLALQVSAGKLVEAEAGDDHTGTAPNDVTRVTASATYHRRFEAASLWATTVAWGRNHEAGMSSNGWLVESALMLNDRHAWFGRFEVVRKSAHDLALEESAAGFLVGKLQGGYTRYFRAGRLTSWTPGIGAAISAGLVPASLRSTYGSRANVGAAIYVTLRPTETRM